MEKSYIKTALSSLGVLVILSTILFLLLSIPSQAITNEFDAEYYASRYPDVVSVLGTDPEVLFNHYLTYGIKEGRYQKGTKDIQRYGCQDQKCSGTCRIQYFDGRRAPQACLLWR